MCAFTWGQMFLAFPGRIKQSTYRPNVLVRCRGASMGILLPLARLFPLGSLSTDNYNLQGNCPD